MRDVDNHERRARVAILHALHDIVAVIGDIVFYLSPPLSGRFPQPFQDIWENTPPCCAPLGHRISERFNQAAFSGLSYDNKIPF